MREKDFRRLVSLYCDGEISASGLDRLRRQVQRRPGRRQEFHRLVRLHAAALRVCGRNLADWRGLEDRVLLFPASRRVGVGSLAGSGLAMAASLALLLSVVSVYRGGENGVEQVAAAENALTTASSGWLPSVVWEVKLAEAAKKDLDLVEIAQAAPATLPTEEDFWERRLEALPLVRPREAIQFRGQVHMAGGQVDWRGLSTLR